MGRIYIPSPHANMPFSAPEDKVKPFPFPMMVHDCGDEDLVSDWNIIYDADPPANETTLVKQGVVAMKLAINAGKHAADSAIWRWNAGLDLSMYGSSILSFWIYFETLAHLPAAGNALRFDIRAPDGTNRYHIGKPKADLLIGWNLISEIISEWGVVGNPNLSSVGFDVNIYETAGNVNDFFVVLDDLKIAG